MILEQLLKNCLGLWGSCLIKERFSFPCQKTVSVTGTLLDPEILLYTGMSEDLNCACGQSRVMSSSLKINASLLDVKGKRRQAVV